MGMQPVPAGQGRLNPPLLRRSGGLERHRNKARWAAEIVGLLVVVVHFLPTFHLLLQLAATRDWKLKPILFLMDQRFFGLGCAPGTLGRTPSRLTRRKDLVMFPSPIVQIHKRPA